MRTIRATATAILSIGLLASPAVGVAAQDEGQGSLVTSFTGEFTTQIDVISEGTPFGDADGFEGTNGLVARMSMVSSDPRMTGTVISTANFILDTNQMAPDFEVFNVLGTNTYELTNDGGSWIGEATSFGNIDLGVTKGTIVFVGRGGYEGLTAYLATDGEAFRTGYVGMIFPRPMPETPQPYAAQ